jgi:hypothetical protein
MVAGVAAVFVFKKIPLASVAKLAPFSIAPSLALGLTSIAIHESQHSRTHLSLKYHLNVTCMKCLTWQHI